MDADAILEIKPALTRFLDEFDGCFCQIRTRSYLRVYVSGQLSDLDRKSVEPMADAAGVPPRSLQEFLGLFKWDEAALRERLQRRVAARHADPNSVGVIDETSFAKKGEKTACVPRQHCGRLGKTENCVVSVHLGYVAGDFHTLLDGELFLPEETWHNQRVRCRAAGIPDDVVYRPKWRIALEQVRRALGNGVRFAWLTFSPAWRTINHTRAFAPFESAPNKRQRSRERVYTKPPAFDQAQIARAPCGIRGSPAR